MNKKDICYSGHGSISTNEYITAGSNLNLDDFAKSDAPSQLKEHDIDELISLIGQIPEEELERSKYIISEDVFPSTCNSCSNNPKNGGSGICCCMLGHQTKIIC